MKSLPKRLQRQFKVSKPLQIIDDIEEMLSMILFRTQLFLI